MFQSEHLVVVVGPAGWACSPRTSGRILQPRLTQLFHLIQQLNYPYGPMAAKEEHSFEISESLQRAQAQSLILLV